MGAFNLADLLLPSGALTPEQRVESSAPRVRKRKKQQFVMVPLAWLDRLDGATGQTYRVALLLLYEGWKANTDTVKLGNRMPGFNGVSRYSKWRALAELERRGLVRVERRPKRSPVVRLQFPV
jgi:hypothetical protein